MENYDMELVHVGNGLNRNEMEYSQLQAPDFVMEKNSVDIVQNLIEKVGGEVARAIEVLSSNYYSLGKLSHIFGCWLTFLENDRSGTNQCLESTLTTLIVKNFQSEVADKILLMEDVDQWLTDLISYKAWRSLIYQIAEQYPNSLMINFGLKVISDSGFKHEINNVNTAAQQLEIFSGVLISSISTLFAEYDQDSMSESFEEAFNAVIKFVCHSEHTYLYTQTLLRVSSTKQTGFVAAVCASISQRLRLHVRSLAEGVSALHVGLLQMNDQNIPSSVAQAVKTMLRRNCLNPADISLLYQHYSSLKPPPVEIIRDSIFLNLLLDSLFSCENVKVHVDHRPKYIYLLAYACCVVEDQRNEMHVENRKELDATNECITRTIKLLESNDDLHQHLIQLMNGIRIPVVAIGLLHYLKGFMLNADVSGEPDASHFVLLDEIASLHPNLQLNVFQAVCDLYDRQSSLNDVAELVMARQRNVIDRFIHLLCIGQPFPVIEKINRMFRDGHIDISLVRYFAIEVLDLIEPPFSGDFIEAFLPLVANDEVFHHKTHGDNHQLMMAKKFKDYCSNASGC